MSPDDELRARTNRNIDRLNIPRGVGPLPAPASGFRWCRPRAFVYRPVDTRWRGYLNRYPDDIIGAAIVAFGRCWSVTWKS